MPPMQNFYSTLIGKEPNTGNNRYLFKRPETFSFTAMNLNFRPHDGQNVRLRERYQVTIVENGTKQIYTNENRFLPNTNCGYFQHLYVDENNQYYVEREGQINVPALLEEPGTYRHTTSYDWDLNIYRQADDQFAAVITTIAACNADLRPAAVPNTFVDEANVLDYVKLSTKLAGGNFAGALEDFLEFTQTTIPGYRFAEDSNLFLGKTQIKSVDLLDYNPNGTGSGFVPTAIGDLGLYVPDGFEVIGCVWSIEAREYGLIKKSSVQIDPLIACSYVSGYEYPFPSVEPLTCLELLTQQVSQNLVFYTEADALAYRDNPANGVQGGLPTQVQYNCPDGSVLPGFVWVLLFI
jgi:hypothetical protein